MKETPMMKQYNSFKRQYPDKLVLFRMGDFYETFGEDAKKAAEVLNITLTTRDKKSDPTPLAGFPHHAIDQYLPKIVEAGECAVVVEQLEDPKQAKGVVKRGVTRIVTPGTLEGELAAKKKNPYLLAVVHDKKKFGVTICDLSTGALRIGELPYSRNSFEQILTSFDPVEIVIDPDQFRESIPDRQVQFHTIDKIGSNSHSQYISEFFGVKSVNSFGLDEMPNAITSLSLLLQYVEETQKMKPEHIQTPSIISFADKMVLDRATVRNLDLVQNSYTGTDKESLLWILDNCKTSMGRRELYSWVLNPLIDLKDINHRQSVVENLFNQPVLLLSIRNQLSTISDIYRLIGKIGLNRMNSRDMKALEGSLESFVDLSVTIDDSHELRKMFMTKRSKERLVRVAKEVVEEISKTIVDSPPLSITEGGFVKDGVNEEIDKIRNMSSDSRNWLRELEIKEREKLGIPSLKVRSNKVFGYYIEVTKTHADKVPENYLRKQTLVNSERYITEELKEREEVIMNADGKLSELEYAVFQDLRENVLGSVNELREIADLVTELDILAGFADLAQLNNYVRPEIYKRGSKNGVLEIVGGRHPVVERLIEEQFIENDTDLAIDSNRMMVITGPNMSGKSTYIRQVAHIVLMAQIGAFVPAESAKIAIVDRVFSRVGASDNLAQGRSTFMVEMEEAANIINNATSNSLIILDEVGRGTSTYDGVSIAWSLVEYITKEIKARTLFATHYHELTALEGEYPGLIKNYNVMVKDEGEKVTFMRKIIPGGTDKSYGIYVAEIAGIPKEIINRANSIMESLDLGKSFAEDISHAVKQESASRNDEVQYELFNSDYTELVDELEAFDINEITPVEAMVILQKLLSRIKKD